MNLLPPELRPRIGGALRGSSYAVLGALLVAILAMVGYGFVLNGIHTTESDIASLEADTKAAQEDVSALGPYAEFAKMKETRARSVRAVAETRFDYERMTRELTRILPDNVWITGLDVGAGGPTDPEQGADSPDAAADPGLTTLSLSGCAGSQPAVADTLDRLGALTGAAGVELSSSGDGGSSGSGSSNETFLVDGGGGGGGCGGAAGPISFSVTVTLSTVPTEAAGS